MGIGLSEDHLGWKSLQKHQVPPWTSSARSRQGGEGGLGAPRGSLSSAPVRGAQTQIREVIPEIPMVFVPLPSLQAPSERSPADGVAFLSEEAVGCCLPVLLKGLKTKPRNREKNCPRRCERENTRAGDTQGWLCDGLSRAVMCRAIHKPQF